MHVTLDRRGVVAVAVAVLALAGAQPATAIDFHKRWFIGGGGGLFIHADSQGGGFRVNNQTFQTRTESTVNLQDANFAGFTLGYGIKAWSKSKHAVQMTIDFDADFISTSVGSETGFRDPNASSRIPLVLGELPGPDGDEKYEAVPLGDLKLLPLLGFVQWHWGNERADFYAGPGIGWVLAEMSEGPEYRDFVGDLDGQDDVSVSGSFAVAGKLGSNIRLSKSGRWYMFVEAGFYSTNLVTSGPKVSWPGVDAYFGQQQVDVTGDGIPETLPAELHVMDSGKLRIDGAIGSIGLRYRFGGRSSAAKPEDEETGPEVEPVAGEVQP